VPVLAFAGAPFTVGSYLIEGRPSRTHEVTRSLMTQETAVWHVVMERLAGHAIESIASQIDHGAAAFQLFDSWATALREAHPDAPGIHFGIGCDHLLERMLAAGPRVLGLDWRTSITDARRRMGADLVVQGNLDPALVLAGRDVALAGAEAVLADNAGHPGHIFNLGHGVQPNSDPGVLTDIVGRVHALTDRP